MRSGHLSTVALGAAVLVISAPLAGCSSSTSPSPSSSAASSAAASSSPSPSAADAAAIKAAYRRFFDPKTPLAQAATLLQDGAAFMPVLEQQAKTPFAKAASARVSKVTFYSADKASVVFTISLSGSPALSDTTGFAVREGGRWKVAGTTFCGLLAAQGTPPPVCSQAAATSLPG